MTTDDKQILNNTVKIAKEEKNSKLWLDNNLWMLENVSFVGFDSDVERRNKRTKSSGGEDLTNSTMSNS